MINNICFLGFIDWTAMLLDLIETVYKRYESISLSIYSFINLGDKFNLSPLNLCFNLFTEINLEKLFSNICVNLSNWTGLEILYLNIISLVITSRTKF